MLFNPKHENGVERLAEKVRLAPAVTPELFSEIITEFCTRLPIMKRADKAARLDQLIEVGAWTDAAFALMQLELPIWKLRHLVYADGEWHCSLSKQPNLPAQLDDTAGASHGDLSLAVLSAFIEAQLGAAAAGEVGMSPAPQMPPQTGYTIDCDDFS
jgi:hypothetical protein